MARDMEEGGRWSIGNNGGDDDEEDNVDKTNDAAAADDDDDIYDHDGLCRCRLR
jgi:hypothetical protein